ncbi:MAG: GNAT family N-acetyltransferase [Anaerolineales bacterium]|nr:GNAT family N-acetyltransferase [Anaerolineales bacterium]
MQSMIGLLAATRSPDRMADFPGITDLHEALALSHVQRNTRLWWGAGGQLVAFAFVDQYSNLRLEIDPQAAHPSTEAEIVAWGVECVRRAGEESGESLTLDASCREDDTKRTALFQRHGFAMQETRSYHMVRSLAEPIPRPHAPSGFLISHVTSEQEAEALVALHRAAFGTEHMTVEERLAMMRVPEYDAELDLLVIAPGGRFAAYCLCSISQEENSRTGRNEGTTDPVATHPDFQRRGLAQALLLTGFCKLRQRGMDTAALSTSSENTAMLRTAQSVGYHVRSATLWFSKPVS